MEKKPLIILTGPTAVGKTALSIEFAKRINGEIISADSMQVYKQMDIGTAKVTPEEMQGVKHYLIDIINPDEEFNVFKFQEYAKSALDEIYANGSIPIIAGGTGFYIQSVLYDIDFKENEADTDYRSELEELAVSKGAAYLHALLADIDAESAATIHENNVKRVIRALEYYKQTGQKISEHNTKQREKESPYNFIYFVLNDDREAIYDRINRRVDLMLEAGLLDEVKHLMEQGYTKNMVSMQGIGYKEIIDYYNGEITLDEAVYIIKRDSRHFAKRQLTWFGREKAVTFIDRQEFESTDKILDFMTKKASNAGII